ncbi:MAG TPA: prephenate dehydrogenase [Epulopiscium sp.]|nr:prephenate dehydrogenase [Candidatus Epulonipiscium sp.]
MNKVGIIGLGLIGGSLAKALKQKCNINNIIAMDIENSALKKALDEKVINDFTTVVDEHFSDCDLIFICTPVKQISSYVKKLLPFIKDDCILTDVGSTKSVILNELNVILDNTNIHFIGGHPMTGSEKAGYGASKGHLFENAYYILTPQPSTPENKVEQLKNIIVSIGAIPVILSPQDHDLVTASISHVPHILASALVNMVKSLDGKDKYMHKLAAGGFKDITRIASSSPEMWHNICMTNQKEILYVINYLIEILMQFSSAVRNKEDDYIWNFFNSAKQYRDTFSNRSPVPFMKTYEIIVDIIDQPGSIASIATLLSNHGINIKNIGIINSREYENGVLQIIFDDETSQEKSIRLLQEMNYVIYKK